MRAVPAAAAAAACLPCATACPPLCWRRVRQARMAREEEQQQAASGRPDPGQLTVAGRSGRGPGSHLRNEERNVPKKVCGGLRLQTWSGTGKLGEKLGPNRKSRTAVAQVCAVVACCCCYQRSGHLCLTCLESISPPAAAAPAAHRPLMRLCWPPVHPHWLLPRASC